MVGEERQPEYIQTQLSSLQVEERQNATCYSDSERGNNTSPQAVRDRNKWKFPPLFVYVLQVYSAYAGEPFSVCVKALDQFNNPTSEFLEISVENVCMLSSVLLPFHTELMFVFHRNPVVFSSLHPLSRSQQEIITLPFTITSMENPPPLRN